MASSIDSTSPDSRATIIAGRYRLISKLGQGGMGLTYRVWDQRDRVPVVVKVPRWELRGDEVALRRFAREIQAMLRLRHDHIVPIIDHGEDDALPFVAMRFLPGGTVAHQRRLDARGVPQPLSADRLPLWLPSIAEALDFIHEHGVLHRDVKPANIFFDGFFNPFLGDFGIAKAVDDSSVIAKDQTVTSTNMAIGTPEYMAPEWFTPKSKPDRRSDQYALAVAVYELLSGRKPFSGDKAHIIVEHASHPVPPLDRRSLGLPASLCSALEKALSKDPDERFETCGGFVSALLAGVVPQQNEPGIARLLCPRCDRLLRLPVKAAGKEGRCPDCASVLRIANDISALWLLGEEEGGLSLPDKTVPLTIPFQPMQASEVDLANAPEHLVPQVADGRQARGKWLRAVIGGSVAALLLAAVTGITTHFLWRNYHENQVALSNASHAAEQEALQGEWQKKIAERETQLEAHVKASAESDALAARLRDEIGLLEIMVKDSEEEIERLSQLVESVATKTETDDEGMALSDSDNRDEPNAGAPVPSAEDSPSDVNAAAAVAQRPEKILALDEAKQRILDHRRRGKVKELDLRDITKLTDEAAVFLYKTTYRLKLDSIVEITPVAAAALVNRPHHMGDALSLNGLTTLSDEAAKALSQYKGSLYLNGLTTLSAEAATPLVQHNGNLYLNGVTALSAAAAKALSQYKGSLYLNGLTTLAPEVALRLAQRRDSLELNSVTTLSAEAAKALAQHAGGLSLNGLTTLSDEAAKALSQSKSGLSLNGPTTLSDEAAKALAQHTGWLQLNGLTLLSAEAAKALAQHAGGLSLNGLTTLSDEAAKALSQSKGSLSLNGLTALSAEAATLFAQHNARLELNGLTALPPEVGLTLAHRGGSLELNGVAALSAEAAKALAQHAGGLSLNGLTTLSAEAAKALAQHTGWLHLNGLTSLSDEAAKALAQHNGLLYLNGLTTLSAEAAADLRATRTKGLVVLPAKFRR